MIDASPAENVKTRDSTAQVPSTSQSSLLSSAHADEKDDKQDEEYINDLTNGNCTDLVHAGNSRPVNQAAQALSTVDINVHTLLATAALRQKTFQERRDANLDLSVRDTRKCDYPMTPVPRVPSAHRTSTRRKSRFFQAAIESKAVESRVSNAQITADSADADADSGDNRAFVWQRHLGGHVAQMLTELRRRPGQLRMLLAAQYPTAHRDADSRSYEHAVTEEDFRERSKREETRKRSLRETPPEETQRHARTYLDANDIFVELTKIGFQLGETLYHQIRRMMIRSVKSGVIDFASNLVRLESMFKLELRRQVTLERLQQAVMSKLETHRKQTSRTLRGLIKNESAPVLHDPLMRSAPDFKEHAVLDHDGERIAADGIMATTAHQFKMRAMERVLSDGYAVRLQSSDPSVATLARVSGSDQLGDQVQDKATSAVYNKNRENFPFWKDPPENALTKEETAKLLRVVINSLANVSVFDGLTVEQLIEIAKGTRWKTLRQGSSICTKETPMDNLFVVMEGSVAREPGTDTPVSSSQRTESQRSNDRSLEVSRSHYGELGLLTKAEIWSFTLSVATEQAKVLVLSRDSFDAAIVKIFGGSKRPNTATGSGKRPTSSPSSTRVQARRSSRPGTSSTREQAVAKCQQYRDDFVNLSTDSANTCSDDAPANTATQTVAIDIESRPSSSIRPRQLRSGYQHYPTFPVIDVHGAGSHGFRLKSLQPIAFGMQSVEDQVQDAWAPAFPDTGTLIDYMSAAESNFLLEKRNVLIKENLRAVCTNLPFHKDSSVKSRADEYLSFNQDALEDGMPLQSVVLLSGASAFASATVIDGDPMTLGQFADARKRMSMKRGITNGGFEFQSIRNLSPSGATSATLAKQGNAPFINSSFVSESSFRSFADIGVVRDHGNADSTKARNAVEKNSALPEVDEDNGDDTSSYVSSDHSANASESTQPVNPTAARKMALDSIINTMTDRSPHKRQIMDQEAARRVILQKHLFAANTGPLPSSQPQDSRKRSNITADSNNTGAASQAPLPLRVDLQRRMEAVLAALKMKPKAKLDLVLKYTNADFYDQFADAVVLWEHAAHYIHKREKALDALRKFELVASDPRRHFRSLSTHRLAEQKERDALFYQLNYASDLCRESLDELEKRCGDAASMENRLYKEKMKKDYTELLYGVEQERLRMIYEGVHPVGAGSRSHFKAKIVHGNQKEETTSVRLTAEPSVLSSTTAAATEPRFTLSTPRESIYVSVVDRMAEEEREEREEVALQTPQQPTHKLAARVKQHRQAQLDNMAALTLRQQVNTKESPRVDVNQVRAASAVVSSETSRATKASSLKLALESALGRR